MKRKRLITACVAVVLILALSLGLGTAGAAQADAGAEQEVATAEAGAAQQSKTKDEIVYARLATNGSVQAIYTVNHFSAAKGERITDYGDYESVVNLTNTDQLDASGGAVSFTSNEDNYYYQGNMASTDLPWIFDIAYLLDGAEMPPQDIAGKDGKLELRISSKQNNAVDPTFYDNYMLQITVTLDTEICSNIDAPDGTAASAGKDRVVTFTVLPGNDADFTLTADVRDFAMATGVSVAAVPYSMNMDFSDTEDQFADLEKLPEAIAELNDGVGELEDGTTEMKDGASQLAKGSAGVKSGLDQLSGNSAQLVSGSAQINDALAQIASSLNGADLGGIDLTQISKLPDGLTQLANGLRTMSDGLIELKDGFVPAYAALDGAMQGIPDPMVDEQMIQNLYVNSDPSQHGTIDALVANYRAAQAVKGTYGQVKAAFDGVAVAIDGVTGSIGTMADTLDGTAAEIGASLSKMDGLEQLPALISGLNELAGKYAAFHSGLAGYVDGVTLLASSYTDFHNGIVSFSDGVGELDDGIGELHDGTNTLNDEIADMPDTIQSEIDNLKEQYLPADFDPVSFTSPKNTDTGFVQFVIQGGGIEKPEEEQPEEDAGEAQPETFWDRLVALFTKSE